MRNPKIFIFLLALFVLGQELFAYSKTTVTNYHQCLSFYGTGGGNEFSQNEIIASYRFSLGRSLSDYTTPEQRHQASYILPDPKTRTLSQLIAIVVPKSLANIPVQTTDISFKNRTYTLYDTGESPLLALNDIYENEVIAYLKHLADKPLGFVVRADEALQSQIAQRVRLRNAAIDAVTNRLDPKIENGSYVGYDFHRRTRWLFNHTLKYNLFNPLYAVDRFSSNIYIRRKG